MNLEDRILGLVMHLRCDMLQKSFKILHVAQKREMNESTKQVQRKSFFSKFYLFLIIKEKGAVESSLSVLGLYAD